MLDGQPNVFDDRGEMILNGAERTAGIFDPKILPNRFFLSLVVGFRRRRTFLLHRQENQRQDLLREVADHFVIRLRDRVQRQGANVLIIIFRLIKPRAKLLKEIFDRRSFGDAHDRSQNARVCFSQRSIGIAAHRVDQNGHPFANEFRRRFGVEIRQGDEILSEQTFRRQTDRMFDRFDDFR